MSKLTIKMYKEINLLCFVVFITNFKKREVNAKGDDDFATKTTSMKTVEVKSSSLNKKCEK